MANLIPYGKGESSIVKPKTNISKALVKISKVKSDGGKIVKSSNINILESIKQKVISVDTILKSSFLTKNKIQEKDRKDEEKEEFKAREKALEKNKPKDVKGVKVPAAPKLGLFGWIKRFLFNTLLGIIAVKLLPVVPDLLKIFPKIVSAGEFIMNISGKLLDGFVTFVDWGYKALDGTKEFLKNVGGEGLAENFDKFTGLMGTLIDVAIVTAIATASMGGDGDGPGIGDGLGKKLGGKITGTLAKGGKLTVAGTASVVAGAGLLASALGEGAFQLRGKGKEIEEGAKKNYEKHKDKWKIDPRRAFSWAVFQASRFANTSLSFTGFLLDLVGAPFRYAIELLRFPFLSEKDKEKQANNLAKFDARIREDVRKALNMLTLGLAFKEKGSFGNIFGNDKSQKEMMSKMAGGGKPATRGGKVVGGKAKRSIKTRQQPQKILVSSPKVNPGKSIGGEKVVKSIYPDTLDKNNKKASVYDVLVETHDQYRKSGNLGSLIALGLKTILGDKPSKADYDGAGAGLNNWMNKSIASGRLEYFGGGQVDLASISSGGNYSKTLSQSIERNISKEVNKAIKNFKDRLIKIDPSSKNRDLEDRHKQTGLKPSEISGADLNLTQKQAFATVYELAKKYNAKYPEIVAAQAMHETGYMDPNLSSVFNSSGRTNAFGQTGDRGYGTIVRSGDSNGWTKYPTLDKAVEDNIKLWHRVDNHPQNYEAFETPIEGILAVVGKYSPNTDPANIARGFSEKSYVGAMQKIMKSMGFDPYKKNEISDLSSDAKLKAVNPLMAKKVTPTDVTPVDVSGANVGGGEGEGGVKIAGDLGDFMKANRGNIGVTGSVHQHPRHPGQFKRSYFSYHNQNRALDIGGYSPTHPKNPNGQDEQAPVIKALLEWNKKNGYSPIEIIHGSPAYANLGTFESQGSALHADHVHVAYNKGGRISEPTFALIGEKKPEFIFDGDTTEAMDKLAPGMLEQLLVAKTKPQVDSILQSYMNYSSPYGGQQIVEVPVEVEVEVPVPMPISSMQSSGGGGIDNKYETLSII